MSCAFFTILGLWILYADKSNAWAIRATFALAGFCLFWASYLAWRDERSKRVSSEPNFTTIVEEIYYEFSPEFENTVLIFAMTIVNKGAPSITQGWKGVIEIDGVREDMRLIHLAGEWIITRGNQRLTLYPKIRLAPKRWRPV